MSTPRSYELSFSRYPGRSGRSSWTAIVSRAMSPSIARRQWTYASGVLAKVTGSGFVVVSKGRPPSGIGKVAIYCTQRALETPNVVQYSAQHACHRERLRTPRAAPARGAGSPPAGRPRLEPGRPLGALRSVFEIPGADRGRGRKHLPPPAHPPGPGVRSRPGVPPPCAARPQSGHLPGRDARGGQEHDRPRARARAVRPLRRDGRPRPGRRRAAARPDLRAARREVLPEARARDAAIDPLALASLGRRRGGRRRQRADHLEDAARPDDGRLAEGPPRGSLEPRDRTGGPPSDGGQSGRDGRVARDAGRERGPLRSGARRGPDPGAEAGRDRGRYREGARIPGH